MAKSLLSSNLLDSEFSSGFLLSGRGGTSGDFGYEKRVGLFVDDEDSAVVRCDFDIHRALLHGETLRFTETAQIGRKNGDAAGFRVNHKNPLSIRADSNSKRLLPNRDVDDHLFQA